MARRDEMIRLNEYLAHLAKCLLLASEQKHRTIGLEYGKAAAGASLAMALATDRLVGLPGAEPSVMDLPSMARVTKLPEDKPKEIAKTTSLRTRPRPPVPDGCCCRDLGPEEGAR
jgi:malonate decarboxylase gamma subunit